MVMRCGGTQRQLISLQVFVCTKVRLFFIFIGIDLRALWVNSGVIPIEVKVLNFCLVGLEIDRITTGHLRRSYIEVNGKYKGRRAICSLPLLIFLYFFLPLTAGFFFRPISSLGFDGSKSPSQHSH